MLKHIINQKETNKKYGNGILEMGTDMRKDIKIQCGENLNHIIQQTIAKKREYILVAIGGKCADNAQKKKLANIPTLNTKNMIN